MNAHPIMITWAPGQGQLFAYDDGLPAAAIVADLVALLRAEGYRWQAGPGRCALFHAVPGGYRPLAPEETLAGLAVAEPLSLAEIDAPWMGQAISVAPPSCQLVLAPGCSAQIDAVRTDLCRGFLLQQLAAAGAAFDPQDMRLRRVSRVRHCDLLRDGEDWFVLPTATTYLGGRRLSLGQAEAIPSGRSDLLLGTEGWPVLIADSR